MVSKSAKPQYLALGAFVLAACASGPRPFAPRAPLGRDSDFRPIYVACHNEPNKKDPHHVSCAPEVYESPLAWDGTDNSIFRPLTRVFAVDPPGESVNPNSFDEVADSAWFTNRIGARPMTIDELTRSACEPKALLNEPPGDGAWVIDAGKGNGSSPGFRVSIPGKGKYLIKADEKPPERTTAASVVGAAAYNAVGFFTSCEQIVYVKRSAFKLMPGLRSKDNTGKVKDFDQKALDKILDGASKRGDLIRLQASAWLPGHLVGPFRYEGTRSDDANDVIKHQDRRELRGGRMLAAWLHHFDAREQNTMDSWIADHAPDDSSPGYVRHYYLDTSDCLGSEWDWDLLSRRFGSSYVLDWGDIGLDFITLGIPLRTWDVIQRKKGHEKFGYYNVEYFVPDKWKNEYPNPAFGRMSERDGAWMARILSRFTPEMVLTLARMGQFTDPTDTEYLAQVLEGRLDKILERYLTHLSPIGDVRLEGPATLCGVDLAEDRHVRAPEAFHYEARLGGTSLPVVRKNGGEVCFALPDHAPTSYFGVRITDGVSHGPLVAWLYDRGVGGYLVAGLERPE